MPERPRILVCGANGYVGRQLIPRLLATGYRVRALVRHRESLAHAPWIGQVEIAQGDVLETQSLVEACAGVQVAFYLVHLMGRGKGYALLERQAAENMARAAEAVGVERIVYLGGLVPRGRHWATHLRSRLEVGEVLRRGRVSVTEVRAGIILGAGSLSFELLRALVDALPFLPLPFWARNHTQPVDIDTVLTVLLAILESNESAGKIYEIGGEVVSYRDLLACYAHHTVQRRWMFVLPFSLPLPFVAWVASRLAGVSYPIAYALIDGMRNETLVQPALAFPVALPSSCAQAIQKAVARMHPDAIWRFWEGKTVPIALQAEGFHIVSEVIPRSAELEARLRQWSAPGVALEQKNLRWPAIWPRTFLLESATAERLLWRTPPRCWGQLWLEWRLTPTTLRRTLFFRPRGLKGRLFWLLFGALIRWQVEVLEKKINAP